MMRNLDFVQLVMYTALLRTQGRVTIYRMTFEQANGASSSTPYRMYSYYSSKFDNDKYCQIISYLM